MILSNLDEHPRQGRLCVLLTSRSALGLNTYEHMSARMPPTTIATGRQKFTQTPILFVCRYFPSCFLWVVLPLVFYHKNLLNPAPLILPRDFICVSSRQLQILYFFYLLQYFPLMRTKPEPQFALFHA